MIADQLKETASSLTLSYAETQQVTVSSGRQRGYLIAKRTFDVIAAVLALIVLSPVMVIIAAAVMLSSPGGAIFSQRRCGIGGHYFTCYKFRTMVPDAMVRLNTNEHLWAMFAHQWKLDDDPRVTCLGRFLRRTSLDELPQLWNVLKGDMSIVGPRPVQPEELRQQYAQHADTVTIARPGMTGLWQISGRCLVSYERRVELDVEYVRRRSFLLDLQIIVKTIPVVLLGIGAH